MLLAVKAVKSGTALVVPEPGGPPSAMSPECLPALRSDGHALELRSMQVNQGHLFLLPDAMCFMEKVRAALLTCCYKFIVSLSASR